MARKVVKKKGGTKVTKGTKGKEEIIQETGEAKTEPHLVGIDTSNSKDHVGLSLGVTLNLGDYQSLRIDCWRSVTLEEGDDPNEVIEDLSKELQLHIETIAEDMSEE